MVYKIRESEQYVTSLFKYIEYIRIKCSFQSSKKMYALIQKEVHSLDIFPKRYHCVKGNLYYFICNKYRIYYKVDNNRKIVSIIDIINTRENDINNR